jgi:hypothetical protein
MTEVWNDEEQEWEHECGMYLVGCTCDGHDHGDDWFTDCSVEGCECEAEWDGC